MMTIEEIADEIADGIQGNERNIIKCWNYLFPEERLERDSVKEVGIRKELLEIIREEIVTFEDKSKLKTVYEFATGEDFPEKIDEDISIEDWDEE